MFEQGGTEGRDTGDIQGRMMGMRHRTRKGGVHDFGLLSGSAADFCHSMSGLRFVYQTEKCASSEKDDANETFILDLLRVYGGCKASAEQPFGLDGKQDK